MRRKFFYRRLNREIFRNIFPHVTGESNEGYPFDNRPEMNAYTEALKVQSLFEDVEKQIGQLPKAYGECFRYAMHHDLCERLSLYSQVAKRRAKPAATTNSRLVTAHV